MMARGRNFFWKHAHGLGKDSCPRVMPSQAANFYTPDRRGLSQSSLRHIYYAGARPYQTRTLPCHDDVLFGNNWSDLIPPFLVSVAIVTKCKRRKNA